MTKGNCAICEKEIIVTSNAKKYCKECFHALRISRQKVFARNNTKSIQRRFSGKNYEKTPEEIQAIKEKYKNGVTIEHIKAILE